MAQASSPRPVGLPPVQRDQRPVVDRRAHGDTGPRADTAAAGVRSRSRWQATNANTECHVTFTGPIEILLPSHKCESGCDSCGLHSHAVSPSAAASTLTVTTSCVASDVPCNRRMIPASRAAPKAGPITSSTGEKRDRRRPAPGDVQLPVRERTEHADGAVGEVEHAGRRVRQHEPARGDGKDAAVHKPANVNAKNLSMFLRSLAHGRVRSLGCASSLALPSALVVHVSTLARSRARSLARVRLVAGASLGARRPVVSVCGISIALRYGVSRGTP